MTLEQILSEWEADAKIDGTNLDKVCFRIPSLHAKYIKLLRDSRLNHKKIEQERLRLFLKLHEFYTGSMSYEEAKELGWDLNTLNRKILKSEAETYIQADIRYQKVVLSIALMKERVDCLTSILDQVSKLNFAIKNAIDYQKMQAGN